jgi:hypothetical protein
VKAITIEDALGKHPFQPFVIQFDGMPVLVDHIKAITLDPRRRKTARSPRRIRLSHARERE